jgi:signal transduction histidine kinase
VTVQASRTSAELPSSAAHRPSEPADRELASLRARNAELEAFASAIRHDLRTPLTAIQGFADLVVAGYGAVLGERGAAFVTHIIEAAGRIEDLIAGSSRLADASRLPLAPASVDLSAMALRWVAAACAAEPDRAVDVDIAASIPVFGDPKLLDRALAELLDNAWRATAGRSPALIRVTATRRDGEVTVDITDNGHGFDPAEADRLLQPFQRGAHPDGRFAAGVGLTVAQRIIARHGGTLRLRGTRGAGAAISLTLPE